AAILPVSLTHRVNAARYDALRFERLSGPSGDDVGDEALGVLSRRSFDAGDGGIEEHDFAQRLAQTGLRASIREACERSLHIRDAIESLQDHAVQVAREEI